MCPFSGLPKLRLFVVPNGSAPTHARFAAHSSTASTVPVYGSAATRRPLQSMLTASAGIGRSSPGALASESESRSSASTAASACPGRRTVRDWTIASYCSNSGLREAMFGDASSASSASRGGVSAASDATGVA
jgi:hypothetical protein